MKSLIIIGCMLLSVQFQAQTTTSVPNTERKEVKAEQPQQTEAKAGKSNDHLMSKNLKVTVQPEALVLEAKTEEKAQRTERTPQH